MRTSLSRGKSRPLPLMQTVKRNRRSESLHRRRSILYFSNILKTTINNTTYYISAYVHSSAPNTCYFCSEDSMIREITIICYVGHVELKYWEMFCSLYIIYDTSKTSWIILQKQLLYIESFPLQLSRWRCIIVGGCLLFGPHGI